MLDHIQLHNSSDDGAEFFGGNVNAKHLIIDGADDDGLDTDVGVKAKFQYVIAVQRQGAGDSMIEADSDNDRDGNTPRQNTKLSNFTFVQRNNTGNQSAILLRGGTDYSLMNGVIVSPNTSCLRVSRAQTISATADAAIDEAGAPFIRSVQAQCSATPFVGSNGVTADQVSAVFGAGSNGNSVSLTPSLTSLFINGATEAAIAAFSANGVDSFFDVVDYIGAVKNAADTWYQGWTCNSGNASFGTGNTGLCSSVPTI